jgi:hypothetical protein
LSIVQINPFRPSPSHSAVESQSLRFSVKIFSRSTLAGGGGGTQEKKFLLNPEPAFGGPGWRDNIEKCVTGTVYEAVICTAGERHAGFWWGDLREGDHLEDLGVDGRIILKLILKA